MSVHQPFYLVYYAHLSNINNPPFFNMAEKKNAAYPLAQMQREAERLRKQHAWVQACLNNQIVFAPIDIKKPELKVLDVGCADGR